MASAVLSGAVLAVTWAITAGQHNAYAAHQQIVATMAGEDMMGQIASEDYHGLSDWHFRFDDIGSLPEPFDALKRMSTVEGEDTKTTGLGVDVIGRDVKVQVWDAQGQSLVEMHYFYPKPP